MDQVILVDTDDRETGVMEKLEAHRTGSLHRAISVFVFNDRNELLIHQRASGKYHSADLWTNTCCSHPRPGESTSDAASRRLLEEMGFSCPLRFSHSFIYHAQLENGLTEHEYDHVFTGRWSGIPNPDPTEVSSWRYDSLDRIRDDMEKNPHRFTAWFRLIIPKFLQDGSYTNY